MKLRGWLVLVLLAMACGLTGCSRTDMAVIAQQKGGGGTTSDVVDVAATTGIAYETTKANAPANKPFTIRFKNPATFGHNVVLVKSKDKIDTVAKAADQTGTVQGKPDGLIVAGKVVANGSEDIKVDQGLPAGEYVYICTVPGHTANMQGTLTVQ